METNLSILQDTLQILNQGYYIFDGKKIRLKLSKRKMLQAKVYLPDDIKKIPDRKKRTCHSYSNTCKYSCRNMDTFSLTRKKYQELENAGEKSPKILALNLANPVEPGGGARRGAKAQEEDLCRKSSLLISLEGKKSKSYYDYNRSLHTNMGSHAVIIHPYVEIIKNMDGKPLDETVVVSVMTCAAPMIIYGIENMTEQEYQRMIYNRIMGMLKVAAHLGYQHLILGAFGCGAFKNDAHLVADLFLKAFREFGYAGKGTNTLFQSIDFAVLDRSKNQYNFREFARNFLPRETL